MVKFHRFSRKEWTILAAVIVLVGGLTAAWQIRRSTNVIMSISGSTGCTMSSNPRAELAVCPYTATVYEDGTYRSVTDRNGGGDEPAQVSHFKQARLEKLRQVIAETDFKGYQKQVKTNPDRECWVNETWKFPQKYPSGPTFTPCGLNATAAAAAVLEISNLLTYDLPQ